MYGLEFFRGFCSFCQGKVCDFWQSNWGAIGVILGFIVLILAVRYFLPAIGRKSNPRDVHPSN